MIRIRIAFLSVAALMLVGSSANAQKFKLGVKKVDTEIAGKSAEQSFWIGTDVGDFRAMFEITGREKTDYAYFGGKDRHLNTYKSEFYTKWSDFGKLNSPKTIGFSDPDTFIRGIGVCLNKGKTEVKGVKLTGYKINRQTGAVTASGGTKKWERPNCKWWGEVKTCPVGFVASAVRVWYTKGKQGSGDYYSGTNGISLRCRKLILKP